MSRTAHPDRSAPSTYQSGTSQPIANHTRSLSFDETAREAAKILLEQFWIVRRLEPDKYHAVRERESVLRTFFREKLGFRLIVHRYFAKLEKIPVTPEVWMGIQSFQHPRDYALLCCLLAFLESKNVDEQFLLSDLCEDLAGMYPGEDRLDWTLYEHRKSLVRVLKLATGLPIVHGVDGQIEDFQYSEEHEVLYEVPVVSRYFMRSYPKDLFQFDSKEEILAAEWQGEEENSAVRRRHRVYRQLFLSPVLERQGPEDTDFLYLRNYRQRIRDDVEKYTDFQFELYKNSALLTATERKARLTLYPDNKAIMDIALQFAAEIHSEQQKEDIPLQYDGTMHLTWADFEQRVEQCRQRYSRGWSKQYREAVVSEVARDLFQLLKEWKMMSRDKETEMLLIHPSLVRTVGRYPKDFNNAEDEVSKHGEQ